MARAVRAADVDVANSLGFGVVLCSADGSRLFRCGTGVLNSGILGRGTDMSDMGGEGGSWISEAVSAVDNDLVSSGVLIIGELAVESGEFI